MARQSDNRRHDGRPRRRATDPADPAGPADAADMADQASGEAPGEAAGEPTPAWRRVFAGEERQLREVRVWLASLLVRCPAHDDVVSVAAELAANAVRHTASGRGGKFAVELTLGQLVVRVAVSDGGGPTEPRVLDNPAGETGRGLILVQGLAARFGIEGDERGRLVWADVPLDGPDAGCNVERLLTSGQLGAFAIWPVKKLDKGEWRPRYLTA